MLKHLYIKNFTLIDELDIELYQGFSVITGETGAGKSIILGALGLLLGQRADSKAIKQGAEKCVIEAHFDLSRYGMTDFFEENEIEYDAADCIVRRELTASGKSRAFINDTPVQLSLLKELGEQLVDATRKSSSSTSRPIRNIMPQRRNSVPSRRVSSRTGRMPISCSSSSKS